MRLGQEIEEIERRRPLPSIPEHRRQFDNERFLGDHRRHLRSALQTSSWETETCNT